MQFNTVLHLCAESTACWPIKMTALLQRDDSKQTNNMNTKSKPEQKNTIKFN